MENAAAAVSSLFGKEKEPATPQPKSEKPASSGSSTSQNPSAATDKNTAPNASKDNKPVTAPSDPKTPSSDTSRNASANTSADRTVDTSTAPAVSHTHVKKQHETREQTFVEKEKHQDHYHTTIQPLTSNSVLPEKHDSVQETQQRSVVNDDGRAKAAAQKDREGFEDTSDEKRFESRTTEPTRESEHVHHHLHETVQPVIEKREFSIFLFLSFILIPIYIYRYLSGAR